MTIWRRLMGSPARPLPAPALGRLHRKDDYDVVHVFKITSAEYGIYEEEGLHWLTLLVHAVIKLKPDDGENPEPKLELNLHFRENPESYLREGGVLKAPSYHEELANLTSMYYWSHSPFDGEIRIESFKEGVLIACVTGEADDELVILRAEFQRNPDLQRSFS